MFPVSGKGCVRKRTGERKREREKEMVQPTFKVLQVTQTYTKNESFKTTIQFICNFHNKTNIRYVQNTDKQINSQAKILGKISQKSMHFSTDKSMIQTVQQ